LVVVSGDDELRGRLAAEGIESEWRDDLALLPSLR